MNLETVLAAAGIPDLRAFRALSAAPQGYVSNLITATPEWVVQNTRTLEVIHIGFTQRDMRRVGLSAYDYCRMTAEQICLREALEIQFGTIPKLRSVLVGPDHDTVSVSPTLTFEDHLFRAAMNCVTHVYFRGLIPAPIDTVTAEHVARFMVDPDFEDPHYQSVPWVSGAPLPLDLRGSPYPRYELQRV